MSVILDKNKEYADALKSIIGLRSEPVAIRLVREGEDFPAGYDAPEQQMSHCQAVFRARHGECLKMPLESHNCMVGTSALNITDTNEKVASGEFHAGIGMHDSAAAAGKMISERMIPKFRSKGEVVCPLKDADFEPDVVALIDIPERIYWIVPLSTAEEGGRATFSTSPFQCACEDVTSVPIVTGRANVSLGCFGCRKKTDMAADELACGIPYALIPSFVEHLRKYGAGVMTKAKRDRIRRAAETPSETRFFNTFRTFRMHFTTRKRGIKYEVLYEDLDSACIHL